MLITEAALIQSSAELIVIPLNTSASGILGVITVDIGRSLFLRVSIAASLINLAPLVATITGSTTIFLALY